MLFRKRKADGSGYSYSSLNVARSAISAIAKFSGVSAGNNDMVCFFNNVDVIHQPNVSQEVS